MRMDDYRESDTIAVRMELQADCLAGVRGKRTDTLQPVLEPGDLEAALTAASAIGDDRLQQQAAGPHRAGKLHPWQFGAARALVPAWLRQRQHEPVQHLQGRAPVSQPR